MMRLIAVLTALLVLPQCGARTGTLRDTPDAAPEVDADVPMEPPVVSCEPAESWTTIDRRAVVYAEGEDDGWIASWHWSIVDRPPGSLVEVVPQRSETTSLTPDREGNYELEVIATDNQGLTDSCSLTIHSIVGPPVAFCPDDIMGAVVGRPYILEGDGFDDVRLVSFFWEVTSRPAGSRALPEPPDQPVTSFTPDVAGTFELTLTVTDNEGETGSCVVSVSSSGPPTAICPDDATVPTRQPHRLHGDAEDDGEIVVWNWELLESPPESTARPAPPAARDTMLTPDRAGPYVLRLTVTDDTGLSDSCETTVMATPTPPDAICPARINTTPLTEVTLRGDAEDDGFVVAWEWALISGPPGSSAPPPDPPDSQVAAFMPDVAGEYRVRLTVIDDDGMEGSCETTVAAIPGEGLRVELYWNAPDRSCDTYEGPDCDSTDVDLHLLHPEAPNWFDAGGGSLDCYYATCIGGTEWDDPGLTDNPRLDLDDVEGFGPENINIDEPNVGFAYTVGVHFYSDDGTGDPALAHISIYCGTLDVDPVYEVGPVALRASGWDPMSNQFWRVATVTWDGVRCRVTPLANAAGEPDIIIASEAERHR